MGVLGIQCNRYSDREAGVRSVGAGLNNLRIAQTLKATKTSIRGNRTTPMMMPMKQDHESNLQASRGAAQYGVYGASSESSSDNARPTVRAEIILEPPRMENIQSMFA